MGGDNAIARIDIDGGDGGGNRGDNGKPAGDCGHILQVHRYTPQWNVH